MSELATPKAPRKPLPLVLDEPKYRALINGNIGYCVKCGQYAVDKVANDARRIKCFGCGLEAVYGLEELRIIGCVRII